MEKVYNDEWDSWEHPERRKRRKANAEANSSSDNRINSNNNNSRIIINQTSKDNKSEVPLPCQLFLAFADCEQDSGPKGAMFFKMLRIFVPPSVGLSVHTSIILSLGPGA